MTAIYTVAPYPRTSDDIIQALVPESISLDTPKKARPTPIGMIFSDSGDIKLI